MNSNTAIGGSYYVQADLLGNEENICLLKEMQQMGHEISYHYDVMDSSDKDVPCKDLDVVLGMIFDFGNGIVSVHPHRWTASAVGYRVKTLLFKMICFIAKKMMKIPLLKKIMGKYYYLAKKI